MSISKSRFALLFVIVGMVQLQSVHAQTFRGGINGTVSDPSGAVVSNAVVIATDTATGVDHKTVSTGEGQFSLQGRIR